MRGQARGGRGWERGGCWQGTGEHPRANKFTFAVGFHSVLPKLIITAWLNSKIFLCRIAVFRRIVRPDRYGSFPVVCGFSNVSVTVTIPCDPFGIVL